MVSHSVILRGANPWGQNTGPTILQRTDQDFIAAVLATLAEAQGQGLVDIAPYVAATRDAGGVLKLYQPVHRTFHVAILEIVCDTIGQPRLDPRRIESAGLVLRRLAVDGNGNTQIGPDGAPSLEGWRRANHSLRGWVPFASNDADLDPEPARRPPALASGLAELDLRLALQSGAQEPLAEAVSPLFVAPPDVCEAAGRTLLYGLIPVTSNERSEAPDTSLYPIEVVQQLLPNYLTYASGSRQVPRAGETLGPNDANDKAMKDYVLILRGLAAMFDAFGTTPQAQAFFDALNTIALPTKLSYTIEGLDIGDGLGVFIATTPAGVHLQRAADVLARGKTNDELLQQYDSTTVTMPLSWPPIDATQAATILQTAKAALDARLATLRPQKGRFDDLTRQYTIRAFARVKDEDGDCPPATIWSPDSEAFTIAPWYDSSGVPPVQIALPDILSREALQALKPDVSFAVPSKLFNFLNQNDATKMLAGKINPVSDNPAIMWICSFNIPIITLCAFIVLNLFLALFNIVFSWLLIIKICLPLPRRL